MSADAEEFVNQLSLTCKDHLTLPSSRPFAHSIRSSIAIAIQRGNAITVQAGFSRAIMRAAVICIVYHIRDQLPLSIDLYSLDFLEQGK